MSFTEALPTVNALLNGTATVLLTIGFACIKTKREKAHRACMISAFSVSVIFLFFYVLHKYLVQGVHTPFAGEGAWRTIYYTMLISHIILAVLIVPLVLTTLTLAIKDQREKHRAWARWTFPIWYYVSVTGVLIYCFLYQWF
ncbi:MAG: putative membrane protein [Lentimonas sp.]|jgi:putative membrane protein